MVEGPNDAFFSFKIITPRKDSRLWELQRGWYDADIIDFIRIL